VRHGRRRQGGGSIEVASARVRCREFDRRAILPALHRAILDFLHVRNGVGEPYADANQKRDDDHRENVHQHAMPIIDVAVVLFVLCEIVGGITLAVIRLDC